MQNKLRNSIGITINSINNTIVIILILAGIIILAIDEWRINRKN